MGRRWEEEVFNNSPLERLWRHRIKKFLGDVLSTIDIEYSLKHKIIISATNLALDFTLHRTVLRVNLYDIALASLILTLERYGKYISPVVLIGKIARRKLRKKVTFGKVLRSLHFIKNTERTLVRDRAKKIAINVLSGKCNYEEIKSILQQIDKIATAPTNDPRVLAAATSYIVLKRTKKWSAARIEKIFGVSRFTVLKRYKDL